MRRVDILILGAGPTGLGAATRLQQLRVNEQLAPTYLLVDARPVAGGWAGSATTPEGFTFDFGGHVLYPHRRYVAFGRLLGELGIEFYSSLPKRGVLMRGRLIPYPVQRNIQQLPGRMAMACFMGLAGARLTSAFGARPRAADGESLDGYLKRNFGAGLTEFVLGPLNEKMWACSTAELDSAWTQYRSGSQIANVADVSFLELLRNLLLQRDDPGWTPDTRVPYPLHGGTGALWQSVACRLPAANLLLGRRVISLDARSRTATLDGGERIAYRMLLSSMPLDVLLRSFGDRHDLHVHAGRLRCSATRLLGLGMRGPMPAWLRDVHSFHVPDRTVPFWRVTLPGAFSPGNVPCGDGCWSILCESSEPQRPAAADPGRRFGAEVEKGLIAMGVLPKSTRVVSRWSAAIDHGYPTPFLGRDAVLTTIQSQLLEIGVWSRGRFGGWRYEISNQDDSFMQGVEAIDHMVLGTPETIYTLTGTPGRG